MANGTDPLNAADDALDPSALCGEPLFNRHTEQATFLWQDCAGDNGWHLRITGGGAPRQIDYEGRIEAPGGLLSLIQVSIERNDVLDDSTDPNRLDYLLRVANGWYDGFDFEVPSGACFTPLSQDRPVYLGAGRTLLTTPTLDLDVGGACQN